MQTATELPEITADLRSVVGKICAGLAGLSGDEVLKVMADFEAASRVLSAGQVRVAGEVGVRSRSELGDEGLSRLENFTSPVKLVSTVTGASVRESKSRLEIGRRLRGAVLLGGGEGPAPFPTVGQALDDGVLAAETASIIVSRAPNLRSADAPPMSSLVPSRPSLTRPSRTV